MSHFISALRLRDRSLLIPIKRLSGGAFYRVDVEEVGNV